MAQLVFNLPDAALPRLVNAYGFDYRETLNDGSPNPLTKAQYAKRQMAQDMKTKVKQVEQHLSNQAIDQSIENDITIT